MAAEDERQQAAAAAGHDAERGALLAECAEALRSELGGRLAHAAELVRSSPPEMSDHPLAARLAQIELLTERAEAALDAAASAGAAAGTGASGDMEAGEGGLVRCWRCLSDADRLLAQPMAEDDLQRVLGAAGAGERRRRAQLLGGNGAVSVAGLPAACAALGVVLDAALRERAAVLRSGVLARRTRRLRAMYLDAEGPVRARVVALCVAATAGLERGGGERGLADALRALEAAEALQASCPCAPHSMYC